MAPAKSSIIPFSESRKGSHHRAEFQHKFAVKVGKAKKPLHLLHRPRSGPIRDCLNLLRIHLYMAGLNDESQKLHLGHMEFTFFRFNIKVIIEEASENLPNMLCVH